MIIFWCDERKSLDFYLLLCFLLENKKYQMQEVVHTGLKNKNTLAPRVFKGHASLDVFQYVYIAAVLCVFDGMNAYVICGCVLLLLSGAFLFLFFVFVFSNDAPFGKDGRKRHPDYFWGSNPAALRVNRTKTRVDSGVQRLCRLNLDAAAFGWWFYFQLYYSVINRF